MANKSALPSDSAEVETQLAAFIDRFTPSIAAQLRACRTALRARMPGAVELVYDNYNALAIGFGADEKLSGVICSLATYPRCVLLYFLNGKRLADPDGLLQGSGNQGRFIRLAGAGAETLDEPGVAALLDAAIADGARPLPPAGHGRTVIKSVSARQRPRRPAEQESA